MEEETYYMIFYKYNKFDKWDHTTLSKDLEALKQEVERSPWIDITTLKVKEIKL